MSSISSSLDIISGILQAMFVGDSLAYSLLQELEDAEKIRQSVIDCFETASLPHLSDDEKRHMLSFLVVGGGPTGVEFAAELHDLVHEDLAYLYPNVQQFISVKIIQSGDHILNTLSTSSSLSGKFICSSPISVRASFCRLLPRTRCILIRQDLMHVD